MTTRESSMSPETYLQYRVDDQLKYYASAANRAKRIHFWMQSCVVVMGVLVPVLVNFPVAGAGEAGFLSLLDDGNRRALVTVVSLALAVLTGLQNFRKDGDLWLTYRLNEELIKRERFLYVTASGRYSDRATAFDRFVTSVEDLISAEHSKFRALVEEARSQGRPEDDGQTGEAQP